MSAVRFAVAFVFPSLLCGACAPKLGDSCENSYDCSVQNTRYCDISQPGGYCTIENCTKGSCGEEGVCVRFRPDEPRLSANWCMASCDSTRECNRDEYVCRGAAQLNDGQVRRIAEVLDGKGGGKFCVAKE